MSAATTKGLDLSQFEGHTEGPWVAQHATGEVEADEGRICEVDPHDLYDDAGNRDDAESDARMCANAALIAAAPALLAECRRQRAEIERLRATLVAMLDAYVDGEDPGIDCSTHADAVEERERVLDAAEAAARAALAGQEHSDMASSQGVR